jgi:hypothetical protein
VPEDRRPDFARGRTVAAWSLSEFLIPVAAHELKQSLMHKAAERALDDVGAADRGDC